MSQENVELIRRGVETLARGDVADALRYVDDCYAPDAEMRSTAGFLVEGPVRGREAIKTFWTTVLEDLDLRLLPEEYIDAGDAVVVVARWIGRGRASGVVVESSSASVWGVRDGQVTYGDVYRTKARALEAAGLRE
jgi:ketosteroid isomerase-like protein